MISATTDRVVFHRLVERGRRRAGGTPMSSPIACNASPFTPEERRRWQEAMARWKDVVQEVRELPDGYAFRIPSDARSIASAAEWITLDRVCCPFLRYALVIEEEGGPAWLQLTGRVGTKEFLQAAIRS